MKVVSPKTVTLVSTSVVENDAPVYNPATTYGIDNEVIVGTYHRIYKALKVTTNEFPPDNLVAVDAPWADMGATNAYKMIDEYVNTQTLGGELLDIVIDSSRCNSIALFGVEGKTLILDQIVDGLVIYSKTFTILAPVFTYTDYFFADRVFSKNIFTTIPIRGTSTVRIRLDAGVGGVAKLGIICPGISAQLGSTEWGVEIGIISFSKKNTDTLGRTSLIKGLSTNTVQFTATLEQEEIDYVNSTLQKLDGIAAVFISYNESGPELTSLISYGYYDEFVLGLEDVGRTTVSFTIKCLI